jgi:hypothetical protein
VAAHGLGGVLAAGCEREGPAGRRSRDASELVSALVTPWGALLWLSAAPLRLAQAHLVARLGELGADAHAYGDHLRGLAIATGLALLVSLYGRAVFARACSLRLRSLETPGREALRVPLAGFATYVYAALAIEAAFVATLVAFVTAPALAIVAGLAAATSPQIDRPGLLRPFALITASGTRVGPLVGLLLVFGIAALWRRSACSCWSGRPLARRRVAGFDVVRWQALLGQQPAAAAGGRRRRGAAGRALVARIARRLRARRALPRDGRGSAAVVRAPPERRAMSRAWRIAPALALALAGPLVGTLTAQQPLTLEDYALALETVQRRVEQQQLVEAQAAARELRDRAVAWDDETLTPDASALDAVIEARSAAEAARAGRRLGRLVSALRQDPQAAAPADPRPDVLARLTPRESVAARRRGRVAAGEAAHAARAGRGGPLRGRGRDQRPDADPAQVARQAEAGPRPAPIGSRLDGGGRSRARVVVVVLSVLVIRRRRLADALRAGEPQRPLSFRRDEDPLSRGAAERERHAAELAAARRWREAIRAWYHAVLVSLFRHGLLHHQKGRTNWEYVARLEPGLAWRPEFMELTSLFDREWYGRRTSDAEALAECARAARSLLAAVRGAGDSA